MVYHLLWCRRLLFIKQPYFMFVVFTMQLNVLIGLEVLILTKQLLLTVAPQEGPNQQLHRSYPTLQDIEAYPKVDILTNCPSIAAITVLKLEAIVEESFYNLLLIQPVLHF